MTIQKQMTASKFELPATASAAKNAYIVNVTPDMAHEWLAYGCFNRELRPETVTHYVRQIKAGLWRQTHQGIAFTDEGILLDGQHRLHALIRTGETLPMLVFLNEPEENFSCIDSGRKRSNLDMLRLGQSDGTLTTAHSQTLKAFLAGPHCNTSNRWSSAELNIEYKKYRNEVCFIVDLFQNEKNKQINDATVRGMLARASLHLRPDTIIDFVSKFLHINGEYDRRTSYFSQCLYMWKDRRHNTRREIYRRGLQTLIAVTQDEPAPWEINISVDPFPLTKK